MHSVIEKIRADALDLAEVIGKVGDALGKLRINRKQVVRSLLVTEDLLAGLVNHSSEGAVVSVQVEKFLGTVSVILKCQGKPFSLSDTDMGLKDHMAEKDDDEVNQTVRTLLSKNLEMDVSVKRFGKTNTVRIVVEKSRYRSLIATACALALGIAAGLLLRGVASEQVRTYMASNVFQTGYSLFLNAIKMIVAPLVFFSMASSIASFGDMKALGKIGAKVIGLFMITSLVAIFIGYGVYQIFPIGNPSLAATVHAGAEKAAAQNGEVSISLWSILQGIVPSNLMKAFLDSNMLQILFSAILLGVASTMIGKRVAFIRDFLDTMNLLFTKAATLIMKCMPVAVFCSITKMVLTIPMKDMLSMFSWVGVIFVGAVAMIAFYCLMLLFSGINPLRFLRNYSEPMATAFSFGSSAATLPVSLKACRDKLGIAPEIYSFSIPLGATINMDGSCITLIISCLFVARVFQINVTTEILLMLFLAIFLLSVGAPGVPGGALVCLSILIPLMEVPAEALSLFIGLYAIVGMILCCTNVTGDAVVSLIIAKREKKFDKKIFDGKS